MAGLLRYSMSNQIKVYCVFLNLKANCNQEAVKTGTEENTLAKSMTIKC